MEGATSADAVDADTIAVLAVFAGEIAFPNVPGALTDDVVEASMLTGNSSLSLTERKSADSSASAVWLRMDDDEALTYSV